MTPPVERRRQFVHAGLTLLALTLRWLTDEQAATLAGGAVVLNWVVLPLLGLDARLFGRRDGRYLDGVKTYPVAVLLLVLLLPLPVAAAGWAVLGIGDAASNLVGRAWGVPPFLGRTDRTGVGTAAFVLLAWPAAFAAHRFVAAGAAPPIDTLALATGAAALAGALAELVPWPRPVDDNLPIALAAGLACWLLV